MRLTGEAPVFGLARVNRRLFQVAEQRVDDVTLISLEPNQSRGNAIALSPSSTINTGEERFHGTDRRRKYAAVTSAGVTLARLLQQARVRPCPDTTIVPEDSAVCTD